VATSGVYVLSDHAPKPPEDNDSDDSKRFCSLKVLYEALCIFFVLWLVDGDKL
jgi:hypothetical protein